MIMADVLKIFLLVTGTLIVLVSYWLAAESLFPHIVHQARQRYRSHPLRITVLGALCGAPLLAVGLSLLQNGSAPAKAIGFALAAVTTLSGLLGSAGLCRQLGAGLPSPTDAAQPWRRVLRGGIVLALTFLLPFVGWFLILPLTLASGFGATVLAIYNLRKLAGRTVVPAGDASLP